MAFAVERTINSRKKKPKVSKARTQADRREARKRLGDEPMWNDQVFIEDLAERKSLKIGAFNWYSYFFEYEDWHPVLVEYAEDVAGLKPEAVRALKALEPKKFLFETQKALTAVKLMRMNQQGWLLDTEEWNMILRVLDDLVKRGREIQKANKAEREQKETVALAPEGTNYSAAVEWLDEVEDQWLMGSKSWTEEYAVNTFPGILLARNETKQNLKGPVRRWIETRLAEYNALRGKEDEQLSEAYDLRRTEVRRRIEWLEGLLEIVDTLINTRRRKTRSPKAKSSEAQVKKFKCQTRCDELGLQSVDPGQLIGAKLALLYNTAYKTISLYEAADDKGIQVQRTKLINIKENPRKWRLRKPSQTINALLETGSQARVNKILAELTTTPRVANGRSNEQTILLKVIR